MDELLEAHYAMIQRYKVLLQTQSKVDVVHWTNFSDTALTLTNSDKLSRWVGFLQGVLFSNDLISVDDERDFSRGIYKPIYDKIGFDSTTVNVGK
jgi:hypothetical protein